MVAFPQSGMQSPEDLAILFSRNLVINPDLANNLQQQQQQYQHQQEQQSIPQGQNPAPTGGSNPPATAPIVYSISQHYHHSSHAVRQQQQQQQADQQQHYQQAGQEHPERPSSEPPQSEHESCENILRSHGIDSSALSPPQLQLFRIADQAQKMRLLQLWSIVPPKREGDDPSLAWTSTTVEREEHLAKMRLDAHMQTKMAEHAQMQAQGGMALDGAQDQTQDQNGRWVASSQHYMEPYMANGYEELMRRDAERQQREREQQHQRLAEQERPRDAYSHFGTSVGGPTYNPATDPVYNNNRGGAPNVDWKYQMQMQMENQYGAFDASRATAGTADAMEIL